MRTRRQQQAPVNPVPPEVVSTDPSQPPYALVMVEWDDSRAPHGNWEWAEEIVPPRAVRCISVGYLVAKSEDAIAIVPHVGDVAQNIQVNGLIQIPRSAIQQVLMVEIDNSSKARDEVARAMSLSDD